MYANISCCQKILHSLPIIPVYLIIITITHSFTKFYYYNNTPFDVVKTTVCGIFYTSVTMVVINHCLSMFVNPGFVNQGWQPVLGYPTKVPYSNMLFCKQCDSKRPERSHHCKICKKCVLKMDHHCPWVANCIGFYNQKYFYLFLFYAVIGNLTAFVILLLKILDIDLVIKNTDKKTIVNSLSELLFIMWNPILLMISLIMSIAMVIAIGFLFIMQTKLIMNNITTIESQIFVIPDSAPWSYYNRYHNFRTVMGSNFLLWLLPIFEPNIYNNGYSYAVPGKDVTVTISHADCSPKYVQLEEIEDKKISNRV
jgi:hypothetical protein